VILLRVWTAPLVATAPVSAPAVTR
jgi:hypothetical protein